MSWQKPFYVLRKDVDFEVDAVARHAETKCGADEGGRYERHCERGLVAVAHVNHSQGRAVDGDRSFRDEIADDVCRCSDREDFPVLAGFAFQHGSRAVDVALHDVAAEPGVRLQRTFKVDVVADVKVAEVRLVERFLHDVGAETGGCPVHDRQAAAIDGDRIPVRRVFNDQRSFDGEADGVAEIIDGDDLAALLHDAGEHSDTSFQGDGHRDHSNVGADPADVGKREAAEVVEGLCAALGGRGAGSEYRGRDVADDPVNESGIEARASQPRPAFEPDMADLLAVEGLQDVKWRSVADLQRGRILAPDVQIVRQLRFTDNDSQRLVRIRKRRVVFVT